jgi:hypothetical protein
MKRCRTGSRNWQTGQNWGLEPLSDSLSAFSDPPNFGFQKAALKGFLPTVQMMKTLTCFFCFLFVPFFLLQGKDAVTKDVAGHDHPLLKRYEGSFIIAHSEKAYDEYKLILGKALNPSRDESQGKRVEREQSVEGRVTRITYLAPMGRSALEVAKNYENELKAKGAETLFSGTNPEGLGYDFGGVPQFEDIEGELFGYSHTKARYGAYKLENS